MEISFSAKKCTQCAGTLEYIKEKKIWKCRYCGAEIEREEQYDGLFTIKNVVRQALLDTACRRLESAGRNLVECEKIDARYVGTLIANLTYEMICIITPDACSERDARNLLSQMKRNYDRLLDKSTSVSDEEEALYEYLDDADIYATLVLVFDSLNDTGRRDYVYRLLDAEQIYSRYAGDNLLTYALKNGDTALADGLLNNPDTLTPLSALTEVLNRYPDTEKKTEHIRRFLKLLAGTQTARGPMEAYLRDSGDSAAVRMAAAADAVSAGLEISLEFVMENLFPAADADGIRLLLNAYCARKLGDENVMRILSYACTCGNSAAARCAMECLRDSGQYVTVPSKLLIALLTDSRLSAAERTALGDLLLSFRITPKDTEAAAANYLNFGTDPAAVRRDILPWLLGKVQSLHTDTIQNYILQCTADGEEKPAVVELLFAEGLNRSLFGELLSRYMQSGADEEPVRSRIIGILSGGGLALDPTSFTDYICTSPDPIGEKLQFIQKMTANGAQIRSETASAYLERIQPESFSSELFSQLVTPASTFTSRALERYLLYCRDREGVKEQNFITLAEHCTGGIGYMTCQISHLGHRLTCSLLQAYALLSEDSEAVTAGIIKWMISVQKMKLGAELTADGQSMKFKKYILENKDRISSTTDEICRQNRVYSLFF